MIAVNDETDIDVLEERRIRRPQVSSRRHRGTAGSGSPTAILARRRAGLHCWPRVRSSPPSGSSTPRVRAAERA
jgi:hypothetical protein